jgi:4-diphosphocytidyl-2-C-methyl-D-erythritol kinase
VSGWAELRAPAKVNLWLHVLERMVSGFHALDSLFCAVSLADVVRVRRAGVGIALRVRGGGDLGPPAANLAVRAAEAFHLAVGAEPAVEIELVKRIPAAAGMGGGSSDAAATLRVLNWVFGDPLDDAALLRLGAGLGSDVPFFLCGSALALGWGRGERLLALPPLPARPVLVVHPGEAMPTAEAFRELRAARAAPAVAVSARALASSRLGDWPTVAALAENDFEPVLLRRIPRLAEARLAMLEAGAEIALLSGSGAAYFGVFGDEAARDAALSRVVELGFDAWPAATLEAMPAPLAPPAIG